MRRPEPSIRPVAFVSDLLADTTRAGYSLLSSCRSGDDLGTIAVIGEPAEAMMLAEGLLTYDRHDNVSGLAHPDQLPDFSGETVALMMDALHSPYSSYIDTHRELELRDVAVRNFVAALDTLTLATPYDPDTQEAKPRSKVVVLGSSYSPLFGDYDIRTLREGTHSGIKVISKLDAMFSQALGRPDPEILVWGPRELTPAYNAALTQCAGAAAPQIQVLTPTAEGPLSQRLLNLLDTYQALREGAKPISAILVDDISVAADSLKSAVIALTLSTDEARLPYKNLLASDVLCVFPGEAVAEQCYTYLREANAFTHRVAYPDLKAYVSAEIPMTEEGESAYCFVALKDRYVEKADLDFMERNAPKAYSIYVR